MQEHGEEDNKDGNRDSEVTIQRELNDRETRILNMISPTTFRDIVREVRRDINESRYNKKKELKRLFG